MTMAANSRPETCPDSDTESRMSTIIIAIGTSAPPGKASRKASQAVQYCGLRCDAPRPRRRISQPPAPPKGTAQSLHRGLPGNI